MKECIICKKSFEPIARNQIYCSIECRYVNQHKKYIRKTKDGFKKCVICNKIFMSKIWNKQCCSIECSRVNLKNKYQIKIQKEIIQQCVICKKKFLTKIKNKKACSKECQKILSKERSIKYWRSEKGLEYKKRICIDKYNSKNHKKQCMFCHKEFFANHLGLNYCSKECKRLRRAESIRKKFDSTPRKLIKKECVICQKDFTTYNNSIIKFCSKKCAQIYDTINNKYKRYRQTESYKYNKHIYKKTPNGKIQKIIGRHKRREAFNNCIHQFSRKEWELKCEATKGICPCCCELFNTGASKLSLDHTPSLSSANKKFKLTGIKQVYTINEVSPLCLRCNAIKNNRDITIEELRELVMKKKHDSKLNMPEVV